MGRDLTLAPGMGGANAQTIPTRISPGPWFGASINQEKSL